MGDGFFDGAREAVGQGEADEIEEVEGGIVPEEGAAFTSIIRRAQPDYCVDDFLATFRFTPETEAMFRTGAQRIGMA